MYIYVCIQNMCRYSYSHYIYIYVVESKLGPILLRNTLGPSFDSTLDQILTLNLIGILGLIFLLQKIFHSGFNKKLNFLFVNTTALTDCFFCPFFLHFCFWGFLQCPVFWWSFFFERNEKTQKKQELNNNNKKGSRTTRCKQENPLVMLQKEQQTQKQNDIT